MKARLGVVVAAGPSSSSSPWPVAPAGRRSWPTPRSPARPLPAPTTAPVPVADPVPVVLPRDDGPHDRLTEWWYYTGHLRAANGDRYGFEYVIFRAERGSFPTSWVSHLAVTDEGGDRFLYSQRLEIGAAVDRSPRGPDGEPTGFDLALSGVDPSDPATYGRPAWTMAGSGGTDRLVAALAPDEAAAAGSPGGLGLDLALVATKPPALHDRDGWIDFGTAGGSYYYSRTAMTATGTLTVDGQPLAVDGAAWFDHQWGDFISVGGGGWDWFAVNLDDGTDLTLSLVRDADGSYPLVYGTLVEPDGTVRHLDRDAFTVTVTDRWRSPLTGADYPAGWSIELPGEDLTIALEPTVAGQELDTRATTGVIYWEGSQVVTATRGGIPVGGEAYVELTGYGAADAEGTGSTSGASPASVTIRAAAASRAGSSGQQRGHPLAGRAIGRPVGQRRPQAALRRVAHRLVERSEIARQLGGLWPRRDRRRQIHAERRIRVQRPKDARDIDALAALALEDGLQFPGVRHEARVQDGRLAQRRDGPGRDPDVRRPQPGGAGARPERRWRPRPPDRRRRARSPGPAVQRRPHHRRGARRWQVRRP